MSYYPRNEALEKMMELVGKAREAYEVVATLNNEISELRRDTVVGELVPFHRKSTISGVLDTALDEIIKVINLEDIVKQLQEEREEEFAIGEVVEATQSIRTISKNLRNKEIDVRGYDDFGKGAEFVILDIDGYNYTLHAFKNGGDNLYFATKDQMNAFFKKSNERLKHEWIKVEFTLNGPHLKFAKDLEQISLFEKKAYEREKYNWDFAWNYAHRTQLFHITADEDFGIMGTAYFKGSKKPNYLDIMFKFGEKFMMGYSQTKEEPEMYKYNAKISIFTKEKGKEGTHYFPKDVLIKSQKARVASILELKQHIKYIPEVIEEEERYAQG